MDIEKRLQPRDIDVINLVKQCGVINSRQIQRVLFKNVSEIVMIRRLKFLADNNFINRARYGLENGTNGYVYYPVDVKKPSKKILFHNLTLIDFYTSVLSINVNVLDFKQPYSIGPIISDGYLKYKTTDGYIKRILIEVQRTGKLSDCVDKYNNIKNIILNENIKWNTIPTLVIVSDLAGDRPTLKHMRTKYINRDLKNVRNVLFGG